MSFSGTGAVSFITSVPRAEHGSCSVADFHVLVHLEMRSPGGKVASELWGHCPEKGSTGKGWCPPKAGCTASPTPQRQASCPELLFEVAWCVARCSSSRRKPVPQPPFSVVTQSLSPSLLRHQPLLHCRCPPTPLVTPNEALFVPPAHSHADTSNLSPPPDLRSAPSTLRAARNPVRGEPPQGFAA